MLDKSVPYYDIIMKREYDLAINEALLPEGFQFTFYEEGDEEAWAQIETSVAEFDSKEEALTYFKKTFSFSDELKRRCLFVNDRHGNKVGTVMAWWAYSGMKRELWLHWVAVKPEYQGTGIGKAMLSRVLKLYREIEGPQPIYLHTQTWSYKAINMYEEYGFVISKEVNKGGYANTSYDTALRTLKNIPAYRGLEEKEVKKHLLKNSVITVLILCMFMALAFGVVQIASNLLIEKETVPSSSINSYDDSYHFQVKKFLQEKS